MVAGTAGADDLDGPLTATTLGTVVSVDSGEVHLAVEAGSRAVDVADIDAAADQFGEGVRQQPGEETVTVSVPGSDGYWKPGHRTVLIEQYSNELWEPTAIQHLFVPLDSQEVLERDGSTLTTTEGDVEITTVSEPAPPAWDDTQTVPLEKIDPGDTIAGLGYMSPAGDTIEVAVVGVHNES